MHPCLQISEIATLICSFLPNHDLLAVALTCKQLKETALDALWEVLPTSIPLVKLFPNDVWGTNDQGNFIAVTNSIPRSNCLSVVPYTARVRQLTITDSYKENCRIFLESVAPSFDGIHIFPNLRKLNFQPSLGSCITFIKLALSPSLTHLTLHYSAGMDVVSDSLLSNLGLICPSVISFTLDAFCYEKELAILIRDSVSESARSWGRIQALDVPALNAGALQSLSQLPHFTQLSLRLHYEREIIPNPIHFAGFESLQHFSLRLGPLQTITDILNTIQTCKLDYLRFEPKQVRTELWEECFKVVAKRTSKSASLKFYTYMYYDLDTSGPADPKILRPLLEAGNLTALCLSDSPRWGPSLTDSFIEELSQASPNLTQLSLGLSEFFPEEPNLALPLTLNSYGHVLKHCPKIYLIHIPVDPNADFVADDVDEGKVRQHNEAVTLYVTIIKVQNPRKVAAFFLPFFSESTITILTSAQALYGVDVNTGWGEVKDNLTYLIDTRAERLETERKRMRNKS